MEPSSRALFSKCCLVALCLVRAHAQDLPEGKGKGLVEQVCVACHGLEAVTGQRATLKGWNGIIDDMIQRGATAKPEEFRTIAEYLATNFGKVNVNKATAKEIETALELTGSEAEAIVKYREEHGEFKDWDGLSKAGVDPKKLQGKKDRVAFR